MKIIMKVIATDSNHDNNAVTVTSTDTAYDNMSMSQSSGLIFRRNQPLVEFHFGQGGIAD